MSMSQSQMGALRPSPLLRGALALDAIASSGAGLASIVAAGALAAPLGLSESALRWIGAAFLVWAALVGWLWRRPALSPTPVRIVAGLNLVYAVECFALLAFGWLAPTGLGAALIAAQALGVAALAGAQALGLSRSVGA
jgi:hypothetical protein